MENEFEMITIRKVDYDHLQWRIKHLGKVVQGLVDQLTDVENFRTRQMIVPHKKCKDIIKEKELIKSGNKTKTG